MSRTQLAQLMGITIPDLDRRMRDLKAHCDSVGVKCPVTIRRDSKGRVRYSIAPPAAAALQRAMTAN